MRIQSRKCAVTFRFVPFTLLFPLLFVVQRSSSTEIVNQRHSSENGEQRKLYSSEQVTHSSSEERVPITESENFLQKIREHCNTHHALAVICNNLKLVIPLSNAKSTNSSTEMKDPDEASVQEADEISMSGRDEIAMRGGEDFSMRGDGISMQGDGISMPERENIPVVENIKNRHIYTSRETSEDRVSTTSNSEEFRTNDKLNLQNNLHDQTLPTNSVNRNPFAQHMSLGQIYDYIYANHIPENLFNGKVASGSLIDSTSKLPEVKPTEYPSNENHHHHYHQPPLHKKWEDTIGNIFEETEQANKPPFQTHELSESHKINVNRMKNVANVKTDVFDGLNEGFVSEINVLTTPNAIYDRNSGSSSGPEEENLDYDDEEGSGEGEIQSENFERLRLKEAEISDYIREGRISTEINNMTDLIITANAGNGTEALGNATTGNLTMTNEELDRVIDDSVKVFKESLTIKFPTFERVTKTLKELYQAVFGFGFGMKDRDEARGKMKRIYGPILLGLAVKGAIILISVIGFILKVVAAKVALFSLASVFLIALFAYKKFNAPLGGTIFVHSGSKSVGSYDSYGSGSSHSHRTVKNTGPYEVWDYSKKKKGEYTTPSYGNHQYYSVHYKPYWSDSYTTTLSPYGI